MIRKLHQSLDIPSSSLIKEYKLSTNHSSRKHAEH